MRGYCPQPRRLYRLRHFGRIGQDFGQWLGTTSLVPRRRGRKHGFDGGWHNPPEGVCRVRWLRLVLDAWFLSCEFSEKIDAPGGWGDFVGIICATIDPQNRSIWLDRNRRQGRRRAGGVKSGIMPPMMGRLSVLGKVDGRG